MFKKGDTIKFADDDVELVHVLYQIEDLNERSLYVKDLLGTGRFWAHPSHFNHATPDDVLRYCKERRNSDIPSKAPRITEVRYERLESGPSYSNQRIGVTVLVGEGETAETAMETARAFVAKALGEPTSNATAAKEAREKVASQLREIASQVDFDEADCPF
jgi:hypothetical protein